MQKIVQEWLVKKSNEILYSNLMNKQIKALKKSPQLLDKAVYSDMSKIIKHCLIDDSNDDLTFTKDHAELCALIPLLKLTGNEYMIGTKRVLLKLNGKNACVKIGGGNKRFNEWLPEKIWHEATTFKKLMKYNNLSFSAAINKFPCEDAKQ